MVFVILIVSQKSFPKARVSMLYAFITRGLNDVYLS